jgi:hypothetical protein
MDARIECSQSFQLLFKDLARSSPKFRYLILTIAIEGLSTITAPLSPFRCYVPWYHSILPCKGSILRKFVIGSM